MKTIIMIIKSILLYGTLIYWLLLVAGADSIMEQGYIFYAFGIGIFLIAICYVCKCYKIISYE